MGQVVSAWGNVTEMSLKHLFDGSDEGLSMLTSIISDGHMIEGGVDGVALAPDVTAGGTTLADLQDSITKAFFAFAIPAIWGVAGTHAFILDSGYDCGVEDPEGDYLSDDTMHETAGCYDGKLYYLVYPEGGDAYDCSGQQETDVCPDGKFSAPPGIDALDGERFGGVTIADLIEGSLRTYQENGNANGGAQTDPTNDGSLDDLMDQDITTPGFIRLPVCSPDVAFAAWADISIDTNTENYPCVVKPSISDCEDSSFEDQTSEDRKSVV